MSIGDPTRIPVIIGTGQINDRPATGAEGLDPVQLIAAAARKADADGGGNLLARCDWLGLVNQIGFAELDGRLVELVGEALCIAPRTARETPQPTGDSPVLLLNDAANAIGRGQATAALIAGAEALRTAGMRRKEMAATGQQGPYPKRVPVDPEPRHLYGLDTPTDVYPLFENAARSNFGQSFDEAQGESGLLWAGMSQIAADNPNAWLRKPLAPNDIVEATADNRPIAFPYTKFQVANAAVNQGAAVIVTSLAVARDIGVPDAHLIYVGQGAAAHEADDPLMRPDYGFSVSMDVSIKKALELNDLTASQIDLFELYSCFPIVPKLARRILGIEAEMPITQFGGLTFGGGPIGNYMTHAIASMVDTLRREGTNALLFANGGYATHNHTIVLTRTPQPAGTFPQDFDCQAKADARRGTVPAIDIHRTGAGQLETYTVLFERDGSPKTGVVIARMDNDTRTLAAIPASDEPAIARLLTGDPDMIGAGGQVTRSGDRNVWRFD
ncbi:MAG: acetyl-CoA acetyltransferase [Pontixanthobacter sp.]